MTPERRAQLQFQSENGGFTSGMVTGWVKTGRAFPDHATMIQIAPSELRELLAHYPKEENHEQEG